VHQRLVRNTRGSLFSLCERSRTQADRFPRYPPLPVVACDGFQAAADARPQRSSGP